MGTQRPVVIGEEMPEELGGPIAEHHGKKKEKPKSKKENIEEKIKAQKFAKDTQTKDAELAEPENKTQESQKQAPKKKAKQGKRKIRSQKYQAAQKLIESEKIYPLEEALDLVKKTSITKFDGNVEVHVRILSKNGKPENVRGTLKYPHSTGKQIKVVILDENLIEEISKSAKADFDLALATPQMMPKVAKLAKILGPKGKMPNPKSGTVTATPEKTKEELEGGMTEYKTDSFGIIHQIIGKVSADKKALSENFRALLGVLPQDKISTLHLVATMGPAIKTSIKE